MRRFSQRSHLVTLNEINITPLLDLAFVLLIIFMITTPLLTQGILVLPKGGEPDPQLKPGDFKTLELIRRNVYRFEGAEMDVRNLWPRLAAAKQRNPSVIIFIRADHGAPWQHVFEVFDYCRQLNLGVSYRSEALEARR